MSTEEVFTDIYARHKWGGTDGEFSSGAGTRNDGIVGPYVAAVRRWLEEIDAGTLTVVDLGCGDFHIGRQLADLCLQYIGVDIVAPLIQHNTRAFGTDRIAFKHLNMLADPLPDGDVCFLRQVLQHLSNEQILTVLPKLEKYRWTVLTEHHPSPGRFRRFNIDKPHGGDVRVFEGSGVFLDQPPFAVPRQKLRLMLEVEGHGFAPGMDPGLIRTFLLGNR